MHPSIRQEIIRQLENATSDYVVLSSPLLLETDQYLLVDRVIAVDVPASAQIARASARDNNSASQIESIMRTQLSRQERLDRADEVIDNSGDVSATTEQTLALHKKLLRLSAAHS